MASLTQPENDEQVAVYDLPLSAGDAPAQSQASEYDVERDRSLLRQNASWFCQLRWIVVGVLAVAGVAALVPSWSAVLPLSWSPVWPLCTAAVLAVANVLYLFALRWIAADRAAGQLRLLLWTQIALDLAVLTVVVHYLGGQVVYAPAAYLFHIVLACIFLHRWESLCVTVVSALLYGGLELMELWGALGQAGAGARVASAAAPHGHAWIGQISALLGIWVIIWYLVSRLASELRDRECELAATNRRLEASSAERARHMLQTTHQLKAPFAAIHANTQILLGGYAGTLCDASRTVVEKIAVRTGAIAPDSGDVTAGQFAFPVPDAAAAHVLGRAEHGSRGCGAD